jgi:Dual specificity phosphatase, catalytic domain
MDTAEIIPDQLWIGPALGEEGLASLKRELGPKLVVVDLTRDPGEERDCQNLAIPYDARTPKIEDDYSPIPINKLRLVAKIVDDDISSGKKVYLHCKAGIGRSPTCAAAYLVYCGTSLPESREMITRKRSVWTGKDAEYAGNLEEFAKMQDISRVENPSFV